jgi:hypothetical protein
MRAGGIATAQAQLSVSDDCRSSGLPHAVGETRSPAWQGLDVRQD